MRKQAITQTRCRRFARTAIRLAILLVLIGFPPPAAAAQPTLDALLGPRDAVLMATSDGRVRLTHNAEASLVPASIIKLLTALTAIERLGPDYRFPTEFYQDEAGNLTVKGYGDPLLVSETLADIGRRVRSRTARVNDIRLDDSYFIDPLTVPGVSDSANPYDAPNGALCANFNTVNFHRRADGTLASAEAQTPLLPFARQRIRQRRATTGRIVLSHRHREALLYTGHLIRHFLQAAGVQVTGKIIPANVVSDRDRALYTHRSPYPLVEVIRGLMKYSNNFTANQLLIAAGAQTYGPPGNLRKGVAAAHALARRLGCGPIDLVEGSGISRRNRISAAGMLRVLLAFRPYMALLPREGGEYYKTGTLAGIRTRVGFRPAAGGGFEPYVVMLNSRPEAMGKVLRALGIGGK